MYNPLNDYQFENDTNHLIRDTMNVLKEAPDMMSNELPEELLYRLEAATNFKSVDMDEKLLCELIFVLYSCYTFIKGDYDQQWHLSKEKFDNILVAWRVLLLLEIGRRKKCLSIAPRKVFDFDAMLHPEGQVHFNKQFLQSLFN
ncbi:hypothetical protein [uncultured Polaribacter sp.]|uniref:hypothetical protein n=1 Tax=uncultured Polaribacter sp. TaxID=174711 RepID=UPI002631F342|nr:hypothetical protein [uncultured Polaribacter sp.]